MKGFTPLLLAMLTLMTLLSSPMSAYADNYYYDRYGNRVQRGSVLSDILNAPILGGSGNSWQYSPYSSGHRDGYRDGTRYDSWRYRHDDDWRTSYPPGHYRGKGKKLGHYKHRYW